jgi:hypothetical protein
MEAHNAAQNADEARTTARRRREPVGRGCSQAHTSARRSIQRGGRRLQVLHELGAGARPSAEDADKRTLPPPAAACVQIGVAPDMLLTALNQSQNGVLLKLINRMPLATMVLLSAQHTRQLRIGHNVAGAMQ